MSVGHCEKHQEGACVCVWSVCWVDVLVLVEVIVVVVQRLVALVSVQVYGVGLGQVGGFKGVGHRRHKLTEDRNAAMPEGGLG